MKDAQLVGNEAQKEADVITKRMSRNMMVGGNDNMADTRKEDAYVNSDVVAGIAQKDKVLSVLSASAGDQNRTHSKNITYDVPPTSCLVFDHAIQTIRRLTPIQ